MITQKLKRAVGVLRTEGSKELIRRSVLYFLLRTRILAEYIRDFLSLPFAIWKVRKIETSSPQALFDFASNLLVPRFAIHKNHQFESSSCKALSDIALSFMGIIHPVQVHTEILPLLEILSLRRPKVILEIGTFRGGTLFLFTRLASPQAVILSIDLPGGLFSAGYPAWRIPLYQAFARGQQSLYLIRLDSHAETSYQKIIGILGGKKIDFLFIDGDHSYEGVKKDFEMYGPLVASSGIIAFHDIMSGKNEIAGGVHRLWDEIKHGFKYYNELVHSGNQTSCGLGVLFLNGDSLHI